MNDDLPHPEITTTGTVPPWLYPFIQWRRFWRRWLVIYLLVLGGGMGFIAPQVGLTWDLVPVLASLAGAITFGTIVGIIDAEPIRHQIEDEE